MGKVKCSDSVHLHQYVNKFKDVFRTDGKILFRKACENGIVASQHSQVTRHLSYSSSFKKSTPTRQSLLAESPAATSSSSDLPTFLKYSTNMCKVFISADIPL